MDILFRDFFFSIFFFGLNKPNSFFIQEVVSFGFFDFLVDRRSDVYNFGGRSATVFLLSRIGLTSTL